LLQLQQRLQQRSQVLFPPSVLCDAQVAVHLRQQYTSQCTQRTSYLTGLFTVCNSLP
jgi:hypothetical protein